MNALYEKLAIICEEKDKILSENEVLNKEIVELKEKIKLLESEVASLKQTFSPQLVIECIDKIKDKIVKEMSENKEEELSASNGSLESESPNVKK